MKLLKNMAQCRQCEDVIESKHRHDMKSCKCGSLAVDGGLDYTRRLFQARYNELSVYEEDPMNLFDTTSEGEYAVMYENSRDPQALRVVYECTDEEEACHAARNLSHDCQNWERYTIVRGQCEVEVESYSQGRLV